VLRFLCAQGVCPPALVETTAAEQLAARFEQHLQHQQGFATGTIERCGIVARQFLEDRFGYGVVDLGVVRQLRSIEVTAPCPQVWTQTSNALHHFVSARRKCCNATPLGKPLPAPAIAHILCDMCNVMPEHDRSPGR
jgi:hypothetical protein